MSLDDATVEFAVRFYRWSLEDLRQHVDDDFQLLRSARCWLAIPFLTLIDKLSKEDRMSLGVALVKRFQQAAVERTGEYPTQQEDGWVKRYLDWCRAPIPQKMKLVELAATNPERFKVNKRKLQSALQKALALVFPNSTVQLEYGVGPIYTTPIGPSACKRGSTRAGDITNYLTTISCSRSRMSG
jgi:hypothetical protein